MTERLTPEQIGKMIAWDEYGELQDSWQSNHGSCGYGCCGGGKEIDRSVLAQTITKALREAEQQALRDAADSIPTNWLDSLLTGQDSIGQPPYDCPAIERLLLGIKDRLRARADALTLPLQEQEK